MKTIRALAPALVILAATGGILSGCAYNTDDPMAMEGRPYKPYIVGSPYQINGKWYRPKEDFSYDRVGVASWYGPGFDGKRTANGETYDMDLLTAAHPTLPMPTLVSVRNLDNGRSVTVRINDRGPFHGNRIIDLSRRAAEEIGIRRNGTARVRVRVLRTASLQLKRKALAELYRIEEIERRQEVAQQIREKETGRNAAATLADVAPASAPDRAPSRPRVTSVPRDRAPVARRPAAMDQQAIAARLNQLTPGVGPTAVGRPIALHPDFRQPAMVSRPDKNDRQLFIQVGSFTERSNAMRTGERLRGIALTRIAVRRVDRATFYRVRVGPVASRAEGRALLGRIRSKGYEDARIVVE